MGKKIPKIHTIKPAAPWGRINHCGENCSGVLLPSQVTRPARRHCAFQNSWRFLEEKKRFLGALFHKELMDLRDGKYTNYPNLIIK